MRLHRLSLTAIGPFAGHAEIDFSQLGRTGLFLLEGPTGAGKSTVIDALSFALYGRVAQTSASAERLRSHHAGAAADPVVELVFETQSGLYRIRRTPSFDRPKKNGTGLVRVQASVKLWRITCPDDLTGGELLSARVAEADDEVLRAVGLNHAQFVQTVVLPQGEFATFLRSRTEDKKALLQKLFGTEVIVGTQQRLIEARQDADRMRLTAAAAVTQAVRTFGVAAGVEESDAATLLALVDSADATALGQAVDSRIAELAATVRRAERDHAAAWSEREEAQRTLTAAQDLLGRRQRRARLRRRQAELVALRPRMEQRRDELAMAGRAGRVTPVAAARDETRDALSAAQDADTAARGALDPRQATQPVGELRARADTLRELLGTLDVHRAREASLAALQVEHRELLADSLERASLIARAEERVRAIPAELSAARTASEHAAAVAGTEQSLVGELARAQGRLAAAVTAERAMLALAREAKITEEAGVAWLAQEERLAGLRQSWRVGVAGELGLALQDGQECVVCGSVEHPRPAVPEADHVTQGELDAAEQESTRLRRAAELARTQLEAQQSKLVELRVVADQLNPTQAEAKVTELAAAVTEAHAAADRLGTLTRSVANLQDESEQLSEGVRDALQAHAALGERIAGISERITLDVAAVDQARDGFATVAERISQTQGEVRALEDAARAGEQAAAAEAESRRAARRLAAALEQANFADEASWRCACRPDAVMAQLERELAGYDADLASTTEQLQAPELQTPDLDGPEPELPPLQRRLVDAGDAETAAAGALGASRQRQREAEEQAAALHRAHADCADVLTRTAAAIRLGALAAGLGDNQLKMELTTYILIRRFTDVVSAANAQLRQISGGRYELEHTAERAGNARSGLGIRVLDLRTGRPRDPGTLSGGETFYVSLSLALGLADVVRAESGGVDLGTLFIDEGFGSLDAEVLDEVLSVLDSLRAGGRSVGVVSHVAEMKARIADRIEVRPAADGSSGLRVVA